MLVCVAVLGALHPQPVLATEGTDIFASQVPAQSVTAVRPGLKHAVCDPYVQRRRSLQPTERLTGA
jgi:hypothetical protein